MSEYEVIEQCGDDGAAWAAYFMKHHPDADEGDMIGWFANAIEAACAKRLRESKAPEMAELLEEAAIQLEKYLDTYGELNDADPITHPLLNCSGGIGEILNSLKGGRDE